jgi:class 3 adenylate cyclase
VTLSVLFVVGWFAFVATGNVSGIFMLFIAGSMVAVTAIQISMGGYANSGAFVMWGIGITIVATLLLRTRDAIAVGMVIAIAAIALGFAEQSLRASRAAPDPALPAVMFPYTLVAVLLLLMPALGFLVNRLSFERERAEGLLLNVLPAAVAAELKETGTTTARHYEAVSVLFADIVGFTPLSAEMEPEEMVNQLNDVFTYFDALADKYGVEKIRTIGDNYMVASGVPVPRDDHAQALCAMALEMLEYSETGPLSFRLGINSGPVVAGVIGTRKFQYDIWGDTVNTASRMESHGEPGKIQISQTTRDLITDHFATTPRGTIDVKGKGLLPTWWLEVTRQGDPLEGAVAAE